MNSAIHTILDKLKKYPDVKYTNLGDLVSVEPMDDKGFLVTLEVGQAEIIVSADFWHEHFDKDKEVDALDCFAFLLSDACRLRVEYKGDKPKKWTLESFENGLWVDDSTTGRFNLKFWLPTRVEYLQNRLIKMNED